MGFFDFFKKKTQGQPQDASSELTLAQEAGLPDNWVPIDSVPINPNQPTGGPPMLTGQDRFNSGPLPPNFGLATDLAGTGYPPHVPSIRLMPIVNNVALGASIQGQATQIANDVVIKAIAAIPPTTPTTDGLIHGSTPWETDPAAIVLQDEFISGNVSDSQIGSLGWNFTQAGASTGTVYNNAGGPFPYYGEFAIAANGAGTANSGYVLTLNSYNGAANGRTFSPFVTNPPWKMAWVFRFMPSLTGDPTAGFDLTNRAVYIGLGIPVAQATSFAQRPYNFVGLRFDQDTTAPSIGDATFKFEVLQNGPVAGVTTRTSSNGVNNQGGATFSITSVSCTTNVITVTAANTLQVGSMTTFSNLTTSTFLNGVTANVISASSSSFTINFTHANFTATTETGTATLGGSVTNTNMTPTIGKYYRFEMSCSVAGQVDMSLTDGTTTFSATALIVPQYSFNVASGWTFANEYTGEFKVQSGSGVGPIGPFGPGSVLTFSNFTSTAAIYNGSQTVFNNSGTVLQFLTATATGTLSNQTGTITGYPSHLIQASFGTTTSGVGTDKCALHFDFFSFAWNPGVNGGSGTPNSLKPRYW